MTLRRSCCGFCLLSFHSLLVITHHVSGQAAGQVEKIVTDRNVSTVVESVVAQSTEFWLSYNESQEEDNYIIDSEQDLEVAESIIDIFRGRDRERDEDTTQASAQTVQPTFIMVPTANGQFVAPQVVSQPQLFQQNQNLETQVAPAPQIILMPTPMLGQNGALGAAPGGRRRLVRVVRGGGGRGGPRGFGRAQVMGGAGGVMGPRGRRLRGPAPIRQVMALEDTGFAGGSLRQQQPQVLQPIVIQAPPQQQLQQENDKFESSRVRSRDRDRDRDRDPEKDRQPAIIQVITPAAPAVPQQPRTVIIREPLFPSGYPNPHISPQPIIQSVVASSAPNPSVQSPTLQELLSSGQKLSAHPSNYLASASGHSQVTTHSTPNPNGGVSNTIVIQPPGKSRDKRRQKRLERMRKRLHDLIITSEGDS